MSAPPPVQPVTVVRPDGVRPLPIVCDSPHSGTQYPPDFRHVADARQIRRGEDTHVDQLWADAPSHGATLVVANFPRTYIDPNRALDDLDPHQLDGPWPTPLRPGPKSALGYGLVWHRLDAHTPLYDGPLKVADVQARIDTCWRPYHAALQQALDGAHRTHQASWHLNLHSMPQDAYARLGLPSNRPLADFVLGDRDGTTCAPAFLDLVASTLRALGYSVAINDPYKGVALIGQTGAPQDNRHSLQVEVRRPLYMDEDTREPHVGMATVRQHLSLLMGEVAAFVRGQLKG